MNSTLPMDLGVILRITEHGFRLSYFLATTPPPHTKEKCYNDLPLKEVTKAKNPHPIRKPCSAKGSKALKKPYEKRILTKGTITEKNCIRLAPYIYYN